MDSDPALYIISIIGLLIMANIFALIETAFSSVSRNKIRTMSERGDVRADKVLSILDSFDRAITTLLICTNIVHICLATLVTVLVNSIWGLSAVTIATIITTIIVFFLGEMLPKSFAKKIPEKVALGTWWLLSFFMFVFKPLAFVLAGLGKYFADKTKGDVELTVTEDELYDIIEDMAEDGAIDEAQEELLSSVLMFGDIRVNSILTSRDDIVAIDIKSSGKDIFNLVKTTTHSRIPVYSGNIDNIIGVLSVRNYFKKYLKNNKYPKLRPLLDPVLFSSANITADGLLDKMTANKQNMAVIRSNQGKTLGIVSVEDILEEIVGEVYDESDIEPEDAKSSDDERRAKS